MTPCIFEFFSFNSVVDLCFQSKFKASRLISHSTVVPSALNEYCYQLQSNERILARRRRGGWGAAPPRKKGTDS